MLEPLWIVYGIMVGAIEMNQNDIAFILFSGTSFCQKVFSKLNLVFNHGKFYSIFLILYCYGNATWNGILSWQSWNCFPHGVQWPASVKGCALPWVQGLVPPAPSSNASSGLWRSLWWVRITLWTFWHVYTSTGTRAHQGPVSLQQQHATRSKSSPGAVSPLRLAHRGRVSHRPVWVWAAIPLRQLGLHSSSLPSCRRGSAVWWKLCSCRHAAVLASDGQVEPTWAAAVPLCWLLFVQCPLCPEEAVVQHSANTAWPNFTYSSANILVTWCFCSRRVIMILSGVKLYL